MYNRYIPETIPHSGQSAPPHSGSDAHRAAKRSSGRQRSQNNHRTAHGGSSGTPSGGNPLDGLGGLLKKLDLGNVLQSLGLSGLDTGDILLLAILLLLFLEGDNWELVIILGLLVLFGLGDDDDEDECD